MSEVVEWARRAGSAQLRHEMVEFDRTSLAGEPAYRDALHALGEDISQEIDMTGRARLAAQLDSTPLLRAMLAPHGSTVLIEILVVFLAAGGAAIFLTRSGVDLAIAAPVSAVLCLLSALLMALVILREAGRGPMPKLSSQVTVLVACATIPGLGLAVATGTLTDPAFVAWWGMLATSAAIALVLLIVLARERRAIGAEGRERIAADLNEWTAAVQAAHATILTGAADRLAALWATVPPARRAVIEQERTAAADVLAERGFAELADALRGALPGALELDRSIAASTTAWGRGSKAMTSARLVPVVDDRAAAAG